MAINWNDIIFTVENIVIGTASEDVMLFASGIPGESATIDEVSAETLPAGSQATVQNLGTNRNAKLKFGIPRGASGVWGDITGDIADQTDLMNLIEEKITMTYANGYFTIS